MRTAGLAFPCLWAKMLGRAEHVLRLGRRILYSGRPVECGIIRNLPSKGKAKPGNTSGSSEIPIVVVFIARLVVAVFPHPRHLRKPWSRMPRETGRAHRKRGHAHAIHPKRIRSAASSSRAASRRNTHVGLLSKLLV